jgi:hypothetical protein
VDASLLPARRAAATGADGRPATDREWLEIVAAVRPPLSLLEARQLDRSRPPWPAAVHDPSGAGNPWSVTGPVVVAYGQEAATAAGRVAVAALDAWVDSVPSRDHTTSAAFGFNGPKARAPQAVLLAVPPDLGHRLTPEELVDTVLETRALAWARAAAPDSGRSHRVATPAALVTSNPPLSFLDRWPE